MSGAARFGGALAPYAGRLTRCPCAGAVPAAALAEPERLRAAIRPFQGAMRGDWGPACSLWSQHYFGTLIVPAVVRLTGDGPPPGLRLAHVAVAFCPRLATARRMHLLAPAERSEAASLAPLVGDHLARLIPALAAVSGLSARLFWDNAGWPLAWVLGEVARQTPARRARAERLLAAAPEPPTARGLLDRVGACAFDGRAYRRRCCCLRDRLPGVAGCGTSCPSAGRAREPRPS